MPPSEAPRDDGRAAARGSVRRTARASAAKSGTDRRRRHPVGIAVTALVERVGGAGRPRDVSRGLAPGVAGLAAAVQQQHRVAAFAIDVGGKLVAVRAGEGRGGRRDVSRHGRSLRKCQHAGLEHLVADREHVVAAGNVERRASGISAASSCGEPAIGIVACRPRPASATDARPPLRASAVWREPRMQAASAWRSDLVCSAKARNMRPIGSVTSSSDGASSASAMLAGSPPPSTRWMPSPPRMARAHARGMREREEGGDARAHRIAHDIGARDAEMIEQRAHVLRHVARVIGGRIVELGRVAMAAIVERDDAAAGARQRRDPAGIDPVHLLGGGEAVHQHDRRALALVEDRRSGTGAD